MNKLREALTADEVWERVEQATKNEIEKVARFDGEIIQEVSLADKVIPVSLSFVGATILGNVHLQRSTFKGNYVDLDKAQIQGELCLNGLESEYGYSLYLRQARVRGDAMVGYTKLHWLCIGGLKFGSKLRKQVYLDATTFSHGVSIDPQGGG